MTSALPFPRFLAEQDLRPQFRRRFLAMRPDLPPGFNERLGAEILARETDIVAHGDHMPIAGMTRTMTTAWRSYNVLTWGLSETDLLHRSIQAAVNRYDQLYGLPATPPYIQCWANVMRAGDAFGIHGHGSDTTIAGTYYVSAGHESGGTYYQVEIDGQPRHPTLRPETGMLNLFQGDMLHGVKVYTGDRPRLSIAFDIVWEADDGHQFIPLFPS